MSDFADRSSPPPLPPGPPGAPAGVPGTGKAARSHPGTRGVRPGFLGPSLGLGSIAGIPIRVHWSFSLLLLWVAFANFAVSASLGSALLSLVFILLVFVCVLLHELGHSLTAQRYGIQTRSITLSPIGGLAALEASPRTWKAEFWVTLAGPAVNAVIALLLAPVVFFKVGTQFDPANPFGSVGGFVVMLFAANLMLTIFNLIPAFPMDGGRLFRSLLTPSLGRLRATRIASRTGQVCAVLMGIGAIYLSPFLFVIAVFVFIAAGSERRAVETEEALRGTRVSDVMRGVFETADDATSVDEALSLSMFGGQSAVPVLVEGRYLGLVSLADLIEARTHGHGGSPACRFANPEALPVTPHDDLIPVWHRMNELRCDSFPVLSGGRLVGLLPKRSVFSLLLMRGG